MGVPGLNQQIASSRPIDSLRGVRSSGSSPMETQSVGKGSPAAVAAAAAKRATLLYFAARRVTRGPSELSEIDERVATSVRLATRKWRRVA